MTIWVDADSFPKRLRTIVCRAALRTRTGAVFISDRKLQDIKGDYLQNVVVPHGSGEADEELVLRVEPGDLAITHDIPLAARLVEKGAVVLDDRGNLFTAENIRERLSIRDLMEYFRLAGIQTDGMISPGEREIRAFAGALDRELTRLLNGEAQDHTT
jgi:hypothetical protein